MLESGVLPVAAAAAYVGLTRTYFYWYIHQGYVKPRPGKPYTFKKEELDRFKDSLG